jgi:hypothetical protein
LLGIQFETNAYALPGTLALLTRLLLGLTGNTTDFLPLLTAFFAICSSGKLTHRLNHTLSDNLLECRTKPQLRCGFVRRLL